MKKTGHSPPSIRLTGKTTYQTDREDNLSDWQGRQPIRLTGKTTYQTDREDNLSLTPASSAQPRQGSTSRFPWHFWTDAWCRRNGRPLQPPPCGPAWSPGCGERRRRRWRTSQLPLPGTQRAWTGAQSGTAWAAGMHCLTQKRLKLPMFCGF